MDRVISLVNGAVSEVGTYTELMERNGAFADFVRTHLQEECSSDEESTDGNNTSNFLERQESTINHLNIEENMEGEEICKDSKFIKEETIGLDQVSQISNKNVNFFPSNNFIFYPLILFR